MFPIADDTLFVLHPVDAMGFGALWIVLLAAYPFSIWVLVAYTILNLVFGLLGHVGVEPFPRTWARRPVMRWLTTSTFHNLHHRAFVRDSRLSRPSESRVP